MASEQKAMVAGEAKEVFSADALCKLANQFLNQEMFDEAIDLLQQGCVLYPEDLTLKIQLGRARDALQTTSQSPQSLSPKAEAMRQERDVKANLFIGLGEFFVKRSENERAVDSFKKSIKLNPSNHQPYFSLGLLFYKRGDYKVAVKSLARAKAINPFHEDTCYYLALAYFYLERYEDALLNMIDALVLSGDLEKRETSPYQQKLQLLLEKFDGFDRSMRNKLVKERQQKFRDLYEGCSNEILASPITKAAKETTETPVAASNTTTMLSEEELSIATKLHKFFIFKNLDDKLISSISVFCEKRDFKAEDYVYSEKAKVNGLYLVDKGNVNIIKETPNGTITLLKVQAGRFFGDEELLFGEEHRTAAVVESENATILVIDRSSLLNLFKNDRDLALHFYWYFWKNLSFQIRQANDTLKGFFQSKAAAADAGNNQAADTSDSAKQSSMHMAAAEKDNLFKTQGIDASELKLLAKYSSEELYNQGEFIFHEGDAGNKLYIIAEGEVLISKNIEGVGEEALAVLKKGEFFGEMALVDGESRSADAKAHKQGTTVLVIERNVLREILTMDTESACRFLTILYCILNKRLHEIREKIFQWKVMAGGF